MRARTRPQDQRHADCASALPPTRWSVVGRAGRRTGETWIEACESIASLYRPALVRHVTRQMRLAPERAEDLVQAFLVEKVLTQNVFRHASPAKGRFRAFILKTFGNYVVSQLRRQQARKRQPSSPCAVRLDDLPELPADDHPQSESLDVLWARHVLDQTVERVRQECLDKRRTVLWGVMEARILDPVVNGAPLVPYEELVVRFGLRSPSEASNLLITAKRMFARVLREVVRETVAADTDVDGEIRELKRILAQ